MLLQFYILVQGFRVTILFTGQYKTKGLWHNYNKINFFESSKIEYRLGFYGLKRSKI